MTEQLSFPALGWTINLNRVAFSFFNFDVYWYAVMITLGLVAAFAYGYFARNKFGYTVDNLTDTALAGIIGGLVGARLYYVLFSLGEYENFFDVINIRDGGLAIYGGVIGSVAAVAITAKIRKWSFLNMADAAGVGFLLGQGIGRWGNFFNIEAYGSNTSLPWGMHSDNIWEYLTEHQTDIELSGGGKVDPKMPVHPCFLYESIWCILGAVLLMLYIKLRGRKFKGEIALMYIMWYGVGRGFIEMLRTDSLTLGRLRISMALSFVAAATAAVILIIKRINVKHDNVGTIPDELPDELLEEAHVSENN